MNRTGARRRIALPLAAVLALGLAACETDLLEVSDPDVVTPEQAAGPGAVPLRLAGMVLDYQEAVDNMARYAGLFTDEMILSGTFPTRIDVDERNVVQDPDNLTLTDELFLPFQLARSSADRNREAWREALDDPDFEEVLDDVREGLALSNLYGGYIRLYMAELYCAVVDEPRGEPLTPDSAARLALSRFEEAEQVASDAGLPTIANAAVMGQARALLWLQQYADAAAAAERIPAGFTFLSEYSDNQNVQANEYYAFTWAAAGQQARWTVGDGTAANRHSERFDYYDEWVGQGLLEPNPEGINAPEVGVPITLQLLYDEGNRPIVVGSWWEAQMIIAENELRGGSPEDAEQRVNALLSDPSVNPMLEVNPDLEDVLGAFDPVDFTGNLEQDLTELARARLAGLWLTGTRHPTLRRFAQNDGVNLFPADTQGDDIFFPIPQREIDNNPNVPSACPFS